MERLDELRLREFLCHIFSPLAQIMRYRQDGCKSSIDDAILTVWLRCISGDVREVDPRLSFFTIVFPQAKRPPGLAGAIPKKKPPRVNGEFVIRRRSEGPERTAYQEGRLRITHFPFSEAPRTAPSGPAGCQHSAVPVSFNVA